MVVDVVRSADYLAKVTVSALFAEVYDAKTAVSASVGPLEASIQYMFSACANGQARKCLGGISKTLARS